jgi:hypothetical protein
VSKLARPAKIILPILKAAALTDGTTPVGNRVYTWLPNVENRVYPMVEVRRLGGVRHAYRPTQLGLPIIEISAHTNVGLPETEQLYEDLLEVLYDAVRHQTQTPDGYLHSIKETLGATQHSSLFQDSWRVQGLIQLGIRPPQS